MATAAATAPLLMGRSADSDPEEEEHGQHDRKNSNGVRDHAVTGATDEGFDGDDDEFNVDQLSSRELANLQRRIASAM